MGAKRKSGSGRGSAILARCTPGPRRRQGVLIALALALALALGCATPEQRYRTLSIFFDDVPLPESMRPAPAIEEVVALKNFPSRLSKAPTFEWVVHDPDCDECHTSRQTQLAYASPPELCWDCHDSEDFVDTFSHGPFAAGACLECHTPHKSQYEDLLIRPSPELCTGCHDDTTFGAVEQHGVAVGGDCTLCHSPHSSASRHLLNEDAPVGRAAGFDRGSGPGARR